jgi:hypothetical protein
VQRISRRVGDAQEDDTYAWRVRKVVYLLEVIVLMFGKCFRISGISKLGPSIYEDLGATSQVALNSFWGHCHGYSILLVNICNTMSYRVVTTLSSLDHMLKGLLRAIKISFRRVLQMLSTPSLQARHSAYQPSILTSPFGMFARFFSI